MSTAESERHQELLAEVTHLRKTCASYYKSVTDSHNIIDNLSKLLAACESEKLAAYAERDTALRIAKMESEKK